MTHDELIVIARKQKRILWIVLLLGGICCLFLVPMRLRSTPVGSYAAFPSFSHHDEDDLVTFWSGRVKWTPGCSDESRGAGIYEQEPGGLWIWARGDTKFILQPGLLRMSFTEMNNPTNTFVLKRHLASTLTVLLMGCQRDWVDFAIENDHAFQLYLTGDATAARTALLEQERTITKYETAEDRKTGYRWRYILYGRLCAVTRHLGQTNEAQEYYNKAMAILQIFNATNAYTMIELTEDMERMGRKTKREQRQQR
jgi:hypothetical protein